MKNTDSPNVSYLRGGTPKKENIKSMNLLRIKMNERKKNTHTTEELFDLRLIALFDFIY